jgi:hypothetical protein
VIRGREGKRREEKNNNSRNKFLTPQTLFIKKSRTSKLEKERKISMN